MVIFDNSQSYTFHLTGHIPDSLGAISEIETIRTDHNFLTGKIPISLSNMKSLSILNLSHNNLSGTIHMAIDNLQFLTQLDLSDNNLKGEVPTNGVLKNSTAIPLNGNCTSVEDCQICICPLAILISRENKYSTTWSEY